MQATNSHHSLSVSNRKFYWNFKENYFEPINYDSNIVIDELSPSTTTVSSRLPISEQFYEAFDVLKKKLNTLNLNKINKSLKFSGVIISKQNLNMKIKKVISNLDIIKKNYLNLDKELIRHNHFKSADMKILAKFNETLNEIDPDVYLVKHSRNSGQLERCRVYLKACEYYYFSNNNLQDLLGGELILDKKIYQYLGKSLDLKGINNVIEN